MLLYENKYRVSISHSVRVIIVCSRCSGGVLLVLYMCASCIYCNNCVLGDNQSRFDKFSSRYKVEIVLFASYFEINYSL